jgi:hypothetical protein
MEEAGLDFCAEESRHRDLGWSFKAVLPTIAPELDHAALEVERFGEAQSAWIEAADPACDPPRRKALEEALIPRLSDQNPWAHWRRPMDMMRHGWLTRLFHAKQQWSTMSS